MGAGGSGQFLIGQMASSQPRMPGPILGQGLARGAWPPATRGRRPALGVHAFSLGGSPMVNPQIEWRQPVPGPIRRW